ncbi:IS1 transposase [Methyloglobulus morosus KoM1]|uniref:IS1 transposase n=1 Tax=Methyloglobulus morosus KoM1 TaxID=1116472 RepID=V5BIL4_9GAMM|nr:IS1 transposase [Methyloglobulus morosus KoM1]
MHIMLNNIVLVIWLHGLPQLSHLQRLLESLRQRVFRRLHRSVGKETGETAHMERWNNTLRQRVGRMVRKTLSFSKDATWHDGVIHWFNV